jgi:hypothetical protein
MTAAHRSKNAWISPWPEPAADVLQPARAAQEANPLDSSVNRHLLPADEDGDVARQRPAPGACVPRTRSRITLIVQD